MFDMTEENMIEFIKDFKPDDEFKKTLQNKRIDISEEIDIDKTSLSRECMICHYQYFNDVRFKFESNICNKCSIGYICNKCSIEKQKELKY